MCTIREHVASCSLGCQESRNDWHATPSCTHALVLFTRFIRFLRRKCALSWSINGSKLACACSQTTLVIWRRLQQSFGLPGEISVSFTAFAPKLSAFCKLTIC